MSDTPNHDRSEAQGDDVFRDPTAPSDAPSYGSSSGSPERTEQLPTAGDTQSVPTESSVPPPPPPPPGGTSAPQSPYAAPGGDAAQNPYAAPPAGAAPQNPYAAPPAAPAYPSQDQVGAQHGVPGTPPPPAYAQGGYGQAPYGAPVARRKNGSAIALTIVSGVLLVLSCGALFLATIPGLIFGFLGITKSNDDPEGSARMAKIGWIVFAAGFVVSIVALGGLFAFAGTMGSTSP